VIGDCGAMNTRPRFNSAKVAVYNVRSLQGLWEGRYFSIVSPDKGSVLAITDFTQSSVLDFPSAEKVIYDQEKPLSVSS